MGTLLTIMHVIVSIFLILVVLLQSGRGGGMGAALGGASGQIFGGRGAGSFLSRVTTGAAVVFFLTSLTLSMLSSRHRSVLMHGKLPAENAAGAGDAADSDDDDDESGDAEKHDEGAQEKKAPPEPAAQPATKALAPAKSGSGAPAVKTKKPPTTPPSTPGGKSHQR